MLIEGYREEGSSSSDEEKATNSNMSSIKKYDRDELIRIGNQRQSVCPVPESFLQLAKEVGLSSPSRQMGHSHGPPFSRSNSRGGGGGLYGMSIRHAPTNGFGGGHGQGGFGLFGPLVVPPPPPASREPKIVIKTQEKPILHSDPNAWKPGRLKRRTAPAVDKKEEPKSEEELIIEGIVKDTRGILNKLTPENFDRLMGKFMALPLENKEGRVAAVINVLFEKAIDEPAFATSYAKMVQTVCQSSAETRNLFRKQLLDKCQHEFQRSDTDEGKATELLQKVNEAETPEQKEEIQAELEELKFKMRRRALGNVRFIGELFKLQMLSAKIMVSCVHLLLGNPDDEKLESLCKLLSTVGQKLDSDLKELEQRAKKEKTPGPEEKLMDKFFATLGKMSENKKFSSRIRFAIMDLIELRENNWKPRREAAGPKTIEEVHNEAYRQELEEKLKIQSLPPLSPEGGSQVRGRPGEYRGNNTPVAYMPKKGGEWNNVNKAARFQRKPAEKTGSMQSFAPPTSQMFGAR